MPNLQTCEKDIKLTAALELFDEMKQAGIAANVIAFTNIISVCKKCGKAGIALEFFNEMKQKKLNPNVIT